MTKKAIPKGEDNGSIYEIDGSYRLLCNGESIELGVVKYGPNINYWAKKVKKCTLNWIKGLRDSPEFRMFQK